MINAENHLNYKKFHHRIKSIALNPVSCDNHRTYIWWYRNTQQQSEVLKFKANGARITCWFKAQASAVFCIKVKVFQTLLGCKLAGLESLTY
jgi:hypothetical protein